MSNRISCETLQRMKQSGDKIASLTAYDASFAGLLDETGIDIVLVGDSLGMVLHGNGDTLEVTIEDMVYHSRIVAGACDRAMVVTDMPYKSYDTADSALANGRRLVEEGKAAVIKLEGGIEKAAIVEHVVNRGIPVCGHIGMQPQSIREYGGFKVQGRAPGEASAILAGARALQEAGACMIVLECIPATLAAEITASVTIPTIGIGAGVECDGQVLVIYDLLGISGRLPRMAKNFLQHTASIEDAVGLYVSEVKQKIFPGPEHSFQ